MLCWIHSNLISNETGILLQSEDGGVADDDLQPRNVSYTYKCGVDVS